ncbi:MAG TPA: tetraacyldisaccharide 4'-kinase [Armatimonadetes bacterium]|nr:tetraacyldisaccharide 4'-kinase [Armatimonadota bacterium]
MSHIINCYCARYCRSSVSDTLMHREAYAHRIELRRIIHPIGAVAHIERIVRGVNLHFHEMVAHTALGAVTALIRPLVRWMRVGRRKGMAKLPVPVISVGNITFGGSGKSPLVRWIARWYQQRGMRVGIVVTGYGDSNGKVTHNATTAHIGDEGIEHAQMLDNIHVTAARQREAGAWRLIHKHGCDVIILDDGFQYRQLTRDLDIVLVDALHPLHHLCPLLRESPLALARADIVCISKADVAEALMGVKALQRMSRYIEKLSGASSGIRMYYKPTAWYDVRAGVQRQLEALSGGKVLAVAGTAEPYSFWWVLSKIGVELTALLAFPDHHHYTMRDLKSIIAMAHLHKADLVVTTGKDAVKLQPILNALDGAQCALPWYALRIDVAFSAGCVNLERALEQAVNVQ